MLLRDRIAKVLFALKLRNFPTSYKTMFKEGANDVEDLKIDNSLLHAEIFALRDTMKKAEEADEETPTEAPVKASKPKRTRAKKNTKKE